jgi:hypothetical protein
VDCAVASCAAAAACATLANPHGPRDRRGTVR